MDKQLKHKLEVVIVRIQWLMDTQPPTKRQLAIKLNRIADDVKNEANNLLEQHWKEIH